MCSQVQQELDGVGTALAALAARQEESMAGQAKLEARVEWLVTSWAGKIQGLEAAAEEAAAGLEARSSRAHDLNVKQQQAWQPRISGLAPALPPALDSALAWALASARA